jgi:hypothetical protein
VLAEADLACCDKEEREAGLGFCVDGSSTTLFGRGPPCLGGIFKKSSEFRASGLLGRGLGTGLLGRGLGAGLEGWRLRIGGTERGGVGSNLDDLRVAGSSSSKTVAWVIALMGRKTPVLFLGWVAWGCAGHPSSSAVPLMASPI